MLVESLQYHFTVGRVKMKDGTFARRFICKKCSTHLSDNNGTRTLQYHVDRHRESKGKSVVGGATVQSTLSDTVKTQQKKDALIEAALNWVVSD